MNRWRQVSFKLSVYENVLSAPSLLRFFLRLSCGRSATFGPYLLLYLDTVALRHLLMPTLTLPNGIEFFYIDSGIPSTPAYTTYFVIHGHSFHSGKSFCMLKRKI